MSQLAGTNIQAAVVPNDSNDVFAVTYSRHTAGGLHTGMLTAADRDSITADRREWGMIVRVLDTATNTFLDYELKPGVTSQDITDNGNWSLKKGVDETNLVHRTGDEGIAGTKTFTGNVVATQYSLGTAGRSLFTLDGNGNVVFNGAINSSVRYWAGNHIFGGLSIGGTVVIDSGSNVVATGSFYGQDAYVGNGNDGTGIKIKKLGSNSYMRVFDLTNTGNTNSVNFGAVGEGGDLRAHGINFIFCRTDGQAVGKVDTAASSLSMNGDIVSGTGFVGDGSRLTNLPKQPQTTGVADFTIDSSAYGNFTVHKTYTDGSTFDNVYPLPPQLVGAYDSSRVYRQNETVTYQGKLYIALSTMYAGQNDVTPGGSRWALQDLTGYQSIQGATSVTYAQLTSLMSGGTLVPSAWYLLTDHQLTQTITGSSPSTTNTGPTEVILLQANSTSTLSAIGYSQTYPTDVVYYTTNNSDPRIAGLTKGYVYRRVDTLRGNDICYDFRAVKFRRWKNATTNAFTETTSNSNGFADYTTFNATGYAAGYVYGNRFSEYWPLVPLTNFWNLVCTDPQNRMFDNVVHGSGYINTTTLYGGGKMNNNVLNGYFTGNVISGSMNGNNLLNSNSAMLGNTVVGFLDNNTVGSNSGINGNTISGALHSMTGNVVMGNSYLNNYTTSGSNILSVSNNTITGASTLTGTSTGNITLCSLQNSTVTASAAGAATRGAFVSNTGYALSASIASSSYATGNYVVATNGTVVGTTTKNAVTSLQYTNGESTGTVANSLLGMNFVQGGFRYAYGFSAADTAGTAYSWTRTPLTQPAATAAGSTMTKVPTFTASADGAQTITLPSSGTQAVSLVVYTSQGFTEAIFLDFASISGTTLTITADAGIKSGEKVTGTYL